MELWFYEDLRGGWRQGVRVDQVLASERSAFQRIDILDSHDYGRMLVIDGKVQVCEMDEFVYHEMLAHVPLLSHPEPRRVLVVGGGDGGCMREALAHPSVQSGYLAEIDERVIALCREHMPRLCAGQEHDARLTVVPRDASEYIREVRNLDAILVDSSDPEGPSERLFAVPFYRQLNEALAPGGVVALQGGSPFFYREQVERMRKELAEVFRYVRPYLIPVPTYPGGTWLLVAASQEIDVAGMAADVLRQRFQERRLNTRYYSPAMQLASLTLPPFLG